MSRSSWPFNMPMFRIQLKSTAFRSLASFAGVYGSATGPRGACAATADGPPIASTTAKGPIPPSLRRHFIARLLPLAQSDERGAAHVTAGGQIEAIEIHHLVPPGDEVLHELRLRIVARIDFGEGAQLRIRT